MQQQEQPFPQPLKKKKPLGQPIDWSDTELEELSHVTNADRKAALALWHNTAPVRFRTLLEAQETNKGH
jgi:hypothetical protein